MGTAEKQGTVWGSRARDWAEVQERVAIPLYEAVLHRTRVHSGSRVLDIGCGSGIFCEMAARQGVAVYGIDAAGPLISLAAERVPQGDFRTGEMESLPFPDAAFDLVTAFNSFQFAGNPVAALQEASRVSSSGAVVIGVFGKPEECESSEYVKALGKLLPPPPSGSSGPFALSADGALAALVEEAGMKPGTLETVQCPWVYPDEETALRGLMSSGPAIMAMEACGEALVRQTILELLVQFRVPSGGYRITNSFQFMITGME